MGLHGGFPESRHYFVRTPARCTSWRRKGRVEIDLPQKMKRLKEWCSDATQAAGGPEYRGLSKSFLEFQE